MDSSNPHGWVMSDDRFIAGCLAGLAASLILVGFISDTVARHVVQIIPSIFALGLTLRRPATGAWVAIPIFAVWCAVVVAIWLHLLGLSDIADGSYSGLEVVLTVVIAVCSVLGIAKSMREGRTLSLTGRTIAFLGGLALQAASLILSFRFFA